MSAVVPGLLTAPPPEPLPEPPPEPLVPEPPPELVPEMLPELVAGEPPPLQPTATLAMIASVKANVGASFSFRVRTFTNRKAHAASPIASAAINQSSSWDGIVGVGRADLAVVVIVSILCPLLPLPVKLTVEGVSRASICSRNHQPALRSFALLPPSGVTSAECAVTQGRVQVLQNEHLHKSGEGDASTGAPRAIIPLSTSGGDWPWISSRKFCGSGAKVSAP
jgi:hypothetical protein